MIFDVRVIDCIPGICLHLPVWPSCAMLRQSSVLPALGVVQGVLGAQGVRLNSSSLRPSGRLPGGAAQSRHAVCIRPRSRKISHRVSASRPDRACRGVRSTRCASSCRSCGRATERSKSAKAAVPAQVDEHVRAVQYQVLDLAPGNADVLELAVWHTVQNGSQPLALAPNLKRAPTPPHEGGTRGAGSEVSTNFAAL